MDILDIQKKNKLDMKKYTYLLFFLISLLQCVQHKKEDNSQKNIVMNSIDSIESNIELKDQIKSSDYTFEEYFSDNFPEYKFPKLNQYIDVYKEFTNSKTPYLCTSDFNGDGSNDYAILALKEDVLYLMIFNRTEKGYNKFTLKEFKLKTSGIDVLIEVQRKGRWKAIDETILVPYDGITVNQIMDSKTYSYYWNSDTYVRFLYD